MFKQGLKSKILLLTIGLTLIGFGVIVALVINEEENNLLSERTRASELMAEPILHTIYKDMLDERADMPRLLIDGLKTMNGVERVQLIRANGVEEAFQDFKTLDAVREEFGELRPEWTASHPNRLNNTARGIHYPEFKKALKGFTAGRKEAVHYIEKEGDRALFTYLVPVETRPKCFSCHSNEQGARGILMISTSLDEMYGTLSGSRLRWIAWGLVMAGAMTALLGVFINFIVTSPIKRTAEMLRAIAEGKGDLTRRLDDGSGDEIGLLGRWFNKFAEGMRAMAREISQVSGEVSEESRQVRSSSVEISEAARRQLGAVEETSSSIKEMDASIKVIAAEAEGLNASSMAMADSVSAMAASGEEVRANIEQLHHSASSTTAAINDTAISIRQIASHVEDLSGRTEEVVSAIMEISSKVREVEGYSRAQAELAEKVRLDAEDLGMSSVEKTRDGIEKVSLEVASTAAIVNRLGQRSIEIGKVLTVINEVAETTHLLALNATILAAQAGEHGKGFAVIARQVKDLANKTSASTKEIAGLITQVQSEVDTAVDSMKRSSERVEDGVRLSRAAQEALTKILDSSRRSFEMAKMIELATIEQTRGAEQISNVAQVISQMVRDIKHSAHSQSAGAREILSDTALMKELMDKVKHSSAEQSKESRHFTESILKVVEKIKRVADATSEQMNSSKRIVTAVETVRRTAEDNATLAERLERTVLEMDRLSEKLKNTVSSYKT